MDKKKKGKYTLASAKAEFKKTGKPVYDGGKLVYSSSGPRGYLRGGAKPGTPGDPSAPGNTPLDISDKDTQADKNVIELYPDVDPSAIRAGGNIADDIYNDALAPKLTTEFTDLDNEILNMIRGNLAPSADDQILRDKYFGERLNGLTPAEMTAITEQASSGLNQQYQTGLRDITQSALGRHQVGGAAVAPAYRLQQGMNMALGDVLQKTAVDNIKIKDSRLNDASVFNSAMDSKRAYWGNALAQTGTSLEQRYDQNSFINAQVLQDYRTNRYAGRLAAGGLGDTRADMKRWLEIQQTAADNAGLPQTPALDFGSFDGDGDGFDDPGDQSGGGTSGGGGDVGGGGGGTSGGGGGVGKPKPITGGIGGGSNN